MKYLIYRKEVLAKTPLFRKGLICFGFILCAIILNSSFYFPARAGHNSAAQGEVTHNSAFQRDAEVFYVSRKGNNQGGRSWQNAWSELNRIQWSQIGPGDTILIDGGPQQMIYRTLLSIGSSGIANEPIRIQRATEPGRNGRIVLFGGRLNRLPYCDQREYQFTREGVAEFGIRTNDHKWVEVDGMAWQGIVVHGFNDSGIRIDRESNRVTMRNIEIFDNGRADKTSRGWQPDGFGIRVGGRNILIERAIIYDNGQDAIQSLGEKNNLRNLRINASWLHNARKHPAIGNESSNYCAHADGLQIYAGGLIQQLTIENSVIGPGLTNALMLGQTRTSNGSQADIQDVTLRNTLFIKAADNGIFGYEGSNTRNWLIDRVTVHCPETKWHCITLDNPEHEVRNSVFVGSRLTFEDGLNRHQNNCIWNTQGYSLGQAANPRFINVTNDAFSSSDNYALDANSPCAGRGSTITSIEALLGAKPQLYSVVGNTQPLPPATAIIPPVETPKPPTETPVPPTATPAPPANVPMITLAARNGELFEPYALESGAIYQGIDTKSPVEGGLARYRFQISRAGHYRILVVVRAEDESQNSAFINVDGDAIGDYMIWDIPVTSSYEKHVVTWRGHGDHNPDGLKAKTFYLEAGQHTLFVRGREAFTYLRQFQFEWVADETKPNEPPLEKPQPQIDPALLTKKVYVPVMGGR